MRFGTAILSAAAALSSCASTDPSGSAGQRRVTYACEHGANLTVVYTEGQARIEDGDGKPIVMPQRPSGSGFWYESPTHSLRGKGDEVTYTVGRMVPMKCRAT